MPYRDAAPSAPDGPVKQTLLKRGRAGQGTTDSLDLPPNIKGCFVPQTQGFESTLWAAYKKHNKIK